MGTNYYWREKPCPCCGRHDELHIGKSSAGWVFGWHGYRFGELDQWGNDEADAAVARLGIPLDTVARWTEFLMATDGTIWDEYGDQHTAADFLGRAQAKRDDGRNLSRHSPAARPRFGIILPDPRHEWADPSGDDISFTDFS